MPHFLPALAAAAFIAAALSDARRFRIPNLAVAIAVATFAAHSPFVPISVTLEGMTAGLSIFLLGFILYAKGCFGAGDVKLFAAAALWSGFTHLSALVLTTSLSGAILSLVVLSPAGRLFPAGPSLGSGALRRPVPYGIAIAAGACAVLFPLLQA